MTCDCDWSGPCRFCSRSMLTRDLQRYFPLCSPADLIHAAGHLETRADVFGSVANGDTSAMRKTAAFLRDLAEAIDSAPK